MRETQTRKLLISNIQGQLFQMQKGDNAYYFAYELEFGQGKNGVFKKMFFVPREVADVLKEIFDYVPE